MPNIYKKTGTSIKHLFNTHTHTIYIYIYIYIYIMLSAITDQVKR